MQGKGSVPGTWKRTAGGGAFALCLPELVDDDEQAVAEDDGIARISNSGVQVAGECGPG